MCDASCLALCVYCDICASVVEKIPVYTHIALYFICIRFDPTTTTTNVLTTEGGVTVVETADESDYCNVCYMLNHEWMKHGSCYGSAEVDGDAEADAQEYFRSGLAINDLLAIPSQNISSLSGQSGVSTQMLRDFYPADVEVNIICDPFNTNPDEGVFMEVQTCWTVASTNKGSLIPGTSKSYTMVSCQPASETHFTKPCPAFVTIPEY